MSPSSPPSRASMVIAGFAWPTSLMGVYVARSKGQDDGSGAQTHRAGSSASQGSVAAAHGAQTER